MPKEAGSNAPRKGSKSKGSGKMAETLVSRQAYGFRDREFFKLKILTIHEARNAIVE